VKALQRSHHRPINIIPEKLEDMDRTVASCHLTRISELTRKYFVSWLSPFAAQEDNITVGRKEDFRLFLSTSLSSLIIVKSTRKINQQTQLKQSPTGFHYMK
jgi:hypothetical protein